MGQLPPLLLPRHHINTTAWDTCVAASAQSLIYGYSWYLDAVLPGPDWTWMGFIVTSEAASYQAVMPVPLRRKFGIWRVHQPLFCQLLGVFSREPALDPTPVYQAVYDRFRYGSVLHTTSYPAPTIPFCPVRQHSTHVLDLSVGYDAIFSSYTPDRRRNLRRAETARWSVTETTDPEPLLRLFQENHADRIGGGVDKWAYDILRNLIRTLQNRGLANLRYAVRNGQIEAGALFVRADNRIIYLFNAASETGRKGNARTLLIDQVIQQNARRDGTGQPIWFDFESPEKSSVRAYYESFGALAQPFWSVRWSRLTWPERLAARLLTRL